MSEGVIVLIHQTTPGARYFRSCLSGHRRLERIFLARLHLYLCSDADDADDEGTTETSPASDSNALAGPTNQRPLFNRVDSHEHTCSRVLLGFDLQADKLVKAADRANTFLGGTSAFITNADASFIPKAHKLIGTTFPTFLFSNSLLSYIAAFALSSELFVLTHVFCKN